jgi:hypothetical protein
VIDRRLIFVFGALKGELAFEPLWRLIDGERSCVRIEIRSNPF